MPIPAINDQNHSSAIIPAKIAWQTDDTGNKVPVSGEFDDVYFSHADGLAESRHVFIAGNKLPERLANLAPYQCFTIAELGFGTGLNLLAIWQLWRQLRASQSNLATARLQFITTEMHPISLADLTEILALWAKRAPDLADSIEQLLTVYPSLIKGCHRLNFNDDNLTVDIWFGDATDSLAKLAKNQSLKQPQVDAWLLDGFAPSCNQSLWTDAIFAQLKRLSNTGTTVATYSCAGVVKRGLNNVGFTLKKIKGFGRKNEMLTATMGEDFALQDNAAYDNDYSYSYESCFENSSCIIIGAGVVGLMMVRSLANRGIAVTLVDRAAPLAGASGNPRALLAPKMTPIHHVDEHLHTMGYLYSCRLYRQLNEQAEQLNSQQKYSNLAAIIETTGAIDLLLKANIDSTQITDYPDDLAITLTTIEAEQLTGLTNQDLAENLYLPQSGLVNPQALKEIILKHPLIHFMSLQVTEIEEKESCVSVCGYQGDKNDQPSKDKQITIQADNVVICAAYESHQLDKRIFDCRKIRGQLSWFTPTAEQLKKLPKLPLKYGGYCTLFTPLTTDAELNSVAASTPQFLLGASFVRNDIRTDIRAEEHQVSRDKLIKAIPELDSIIPIETQNWQARAGVRTQTPDYHPMVGQLSDSKRLWVMSAMGAKGYAFAPICAETLADRMLGAFAPLSIEMLSKLSPNRTRLKTPLE